jgi:hypothetical protein
MGLNWNRVILGGLLAGLIVNVGEYLVNGVIFATDWTNVMTSLNRAPGPSVKQMIALNLWGFLTGIAITWLYASIRPRHGAGPKTAVLAGAAIWAVNFGLGGSIPLIFHLFPMQLWLATTLTGLVECIVAGLAGGWAYREESQPMASKAAAS